MSQSVIEKEIDIRLTIGQGLKRVLDQLLRETQELESKHDKKTFFSYKKPTQNELNELEQDYLKLHALLMSEVHEIEIKIKNVNDFQHT